MEKTNIQWLQDYYLRLCDGDWEHGYGFTIESLDNPGWSVFFSVRYTKLERTTFERIVIERTPEDWLQCWLEGSEFKGACGPGNLEELLSIFRRWVENNLGPEESPWLDDAVRRL